MEINTKELLGREENILDRKNIHKQFQNKRILVTGSAGSIGRELVNQIISFKPGCLCLIDQHELGMHEHLNLNEHTVIRFELGDITDSIRMSEIFRNFKPQIVFHAAAYKHVSLMECFPYEAVKNNIFGTKIIADLSKKHKVEKFVFISTDKAIKPSCVMGKTKRTAEIYLQSLNDSTRIPTQFIIVRFGNVLGSTGSVYQIFKKQILKGGPVTITDKRASRYFMTLLEAAQLVLEAAAIGKGGEVLVFDMGKPVLIYDLAKRMIKNVNPGAEQKIDIKFIGLGKGEKLHEDLWNNGEITLPTDHPKISIVHSASSTEINIKGRILSLWQALRRNKPDELLLMLSTIVEEVSHPIVKQRRIPKTLLGNSAVQMNVSTIHMD